jgi:hypothetical protein
MRRYEGEKYVKNMGKIIDELDKAASMLTPVMTPNNAQTLTDVLGYIYDAISAIKKYCPKLCECRANLRKEIEGKFLSRVIGTVKTHGAKSEPVTIGTRYVKGRKYQVSIIVQKMENTSFICLSLQARRLSSRTFQPSVTGNSRIVSPSRRHTPQNQQRLGHPRLVIT